MDIKEGNQWLDKELEKAGMKAALEVAKAFMVRFNISEVEFTAEELRAATTRDMVAAMVGESLVFKRKVSK